jgi:TPR repeat protein
VQRQEQRLPFWDGINRTLTQSPVPLLAATNYTSLPMTKIHLIPIFAIGLATAAFGQSGDACPNNAADFAQVQQKANANDPSAQTALAFCYDLGRNVEPSRKENIHWLEQAASQGYAPAEYELGRIYLYGHGVEVDYAKALVWEQKAAEQGDPRAQRDLALMYERGFGVTADPAQAADWNRKAAAQGHPEAQAHLARALADGTGVKKDPAEARIWYAKAASQEHPAAQLQLARSYAGNADCAQAIRWYKEAAAGGEPQAMYELGKLYLTPKCGANHLSAFRWFSTGARFGSLDSQAEAKKLSPSLSVAQRKSTQAAVEQWIKQHPGSRKEEDDEESK